MANKKRPPATKVVKLKKEHSKSVLYHHKNGGKGTNLASLSQEELQALYNEKIYRVLFE